MFSLKNRGITFKLILLILTSTIFIFVVVFGYNYVISLRILTKNIEENAKNLAGLKVHSIDTVLNATEKVPENLAYFLEESPYGKEEIINLLRAVIENNPEIYGATIAFKPYGFDDKSLYFAPYFYKSDGEVKFTYLGSDTYRYFYWDWYQMPRVLNQPAWSEPYYDEGGGNIIMSTYSVPFYKTIDGKREFMGVVTADISLSWLQDIVSAIKVYKTGYGFLISKNGTIVTHPKEQLIMNDTIFSVAEALGDTNLREIGKQMIKGKSGYAPTDSALTGKKCMMVYEPVPSSGWSLGVLFPEDEFMADIVNLSRTVLALGLIGCLLLLLAIVYIANSITRPLRKLAAATERIGGGDLNIELAPVHSRDEVGKLTDSFNYMKRSLKDYIRQLTETTKAKERIESELKIAHDIQMGILPKKFPAFPDRPEFDIYATLKPAREVGGDFYDFFLTEDKYLYFAIGDVSGKGVPAALFMAVTDTLIKMRAKTSIKPGEILTDVNKELCNENESCMFVTIFCGVLNIETGELVYSNGGHTLPLVVRKDKDVDFLEGTDSSLLGVMEDADFKTKKLILRPGDYILCYTDGVTEAINKNKEFFSDERLKKDAEALGDKSIQDAAEFISDKVDTFSKDVPQTDDITLLAVKYIGS
ncbi:MAG: SpoIIE family protein phosphatase [Candidatus Omnitrophica bacterium]|nr:SpoIIE family protein phosphatase [Candidatus Omnitrophota bacterium]